MHSYMWVVDGVCILCAVCIYRDLVCVCVVDVV